MRLIFKIAAGVFLGILAIAIVLRIPTWIDDYKHYREAVATVDLDHLTPDKVIARCGKPLKDESESLDTTTPNDPLVTRRITFKGKENLTILLTVYQVSSDTNPEERIWTFAKVEDAITGDNFKAASERIFWLPCLGAQ